MENIKKKYYCKSHNALAKYYCTQIDCPESSRNACPECVAEGPHQMHNIQNIDDVHIKLKEANKKQERYSREVTQRHQDVLELEEKIHSIFQVLEHTIVDQLKTIEDNYQQKLKNFSKTLVKDKNKIKQQSNSIPNQISVDGGLERKSLQFLVNIMDQNSNASYIQSQIFSKVSGEVKDNCYKSLDKLKSIFQQFQQQFLSPYEQIDPFSINITNSLIFKQNLSEMSILENSLNVEEQAKAHKKKESSSNNNINQEQVSQQQKKQKMLQKLEPVQTIIEEKPTILVSPEEPLHPPNTALTKASSNDNNEISATKQVFEEEEFISCYKPLDMAKFKCKKLGQLSGHKDWIWDVQQIDKEHFATCSEDKSIKIWNFGQKKCIKTLLGHENAVTCLLQLRSNIFATGNADKTIRIWDWKAGSCLTVLKGHTDLVEGLERLNLMIIISCSKDKTIIAWNWQTGERLYTLLAHNDRVRCIILIKQDILASSSQDNSIKLWKIPAYLTQQDSSPAIQDEKKQEEWSCMKVVNVQCDANVLLKLNEEFILSGSYKKIGIWDLATWNLQRVIEAHENWIHKVSLINDHTIISASQDKKVKFWDWKNGTCIHELNHEDYVLCINTYEGQYLLSGGNDHSIHIWE